MKKQALVVVMLVSCFLAGCTDADVEDAEQALGCTYSDATNYNSTAAIDDGSCVYPEPPLPVPGCMYSDALNHNPSATEDDGSCRYPVVTDPVPGCTYSEAYNYEMNATEDDGTCVYDTDGDGIIDTFEQPGCTDVNANNHNSSSTDDDGSCDYDEDDDGVYDWAESEGCTDSIATNYDSSATESNQTMCEYPFVMTLGDLEAFLADSNNNGEPDGFEASIDEIRNDTAFIRVIVVEVTEEGGEDLAETNANTTSVEMIVGHDPTNEIMYSSMVMRFMGDISLEQTTVQGPDGINYRIGTIDSGSWYFARDEVYQYENPFSEEDGGDGGDDDSDDGDSECDEFLDNYPFGWTDNWTLSYADGVNTAEGRNQGEGLDARIEFVGNPPHLSLIEIRSYDSMERCAIEILDSSAFVIEIDTNLPKTSMTMKLENEIDEDSGNSRTWSADLSDEHFEEVNLDEIVVRVYANGEDSEDGSGGNALVTEMLLSEQTSTYTDQCYQWALSWADNDNDGYTSAGDAYTITRTERVIDPCPDDDEYRSKDFQIVFYDLWADMPTGGVFTPGFGLFAAISTILVSSMCIGRRGV
ncbi:MAG: hypothetical protein QGF32_05400 [Candidatus Thalassarchaeaceae archaeon]|nr:hypothetical protein [Candidatus Thalassarchaeaceae archaeon]